MPKNQKYNGAVLPGFTLAELLIALGILGVIAAFSIPKILAAQQNNKYNAVAKEELAALAQAYSQYQATAGVNSNTKITDLTPYLNFVTLDTSSTVDYVPTQTFRDCTNVICYRLHNGAILWFWDNGGGLGAPFGGTSTTHAIEFFIDPDGVYSNSATSPGKSADLFIYYDGRITSRGYLKNPSYVNGASYTPNLAFEPDCFSW